MFFIELPSKTPRTDEFRKHCGGLAAAFKQPEFVPNEDKAKSIAKQIEKADKDKVAEENKEEEELEPEVDQNDLQKQKEDFLVILKNLPLNKDKKFDEYLVKSEEFEKDDDKNFHIDFMSSMGNCRAMNYKLEEMDWLQVKLKAGRIVPALATTTACVAGLQSIELIKILKGAKQADHRCSYFNLAVPNMNTSEPGDVQKDKLLEGLEVSIWDRWDLKGSKSTKLSDVITFVEETYKGLEVRDIMHKGRPLFFYAIDNMVGKEKEAKAKLDNSVSNAAECFSDDLYVDISVTCIKKGDKEATILKGTPPVRVFFE